MNLLTILKKSDSINNTSRLKPSCLGRSNLVFTSLAGIGVVASLALNIAVAEPALMQPVEDIHFQELPPAWLITGESGFSGSKVKTIVPASSRTVVNQAAKTVPAQSPIQSIINEANKGNRDAQYDLGMRYQYGNGVKKSRSKAHRWLNKSAQAGNAQAQYALSLFYQQYARNKQGVKKALLWIKKSADQGLADAQYSLGMMFRNGSLVHKNPVEARKWIRRASIQGHVAAQLALSN